MWFFVSVLGWKLFSVCSVATIILEGLLFQAIHALPLIYALYPISCAEQSHGAIITSVVE
jgi:hypothetical protein